LSEASRKSRLRRVLRIAGYAFGALSLVVGALLAFLHSSSGQAFLRSRIEHALNDKMQEGHATLGQLHFALFGKIEIGKLVLVDGSGAPVVELDSLVIAPAWGDLVRGHEAIDDVTLNGLRLHVAVDAEGQSNLKKLFKPTPPSAPSTAKKEARRVEVRKIALSGVELTLAKADGSVLHVADAGLDASLDAVPSEKTASLAITRFSTNLERSTADGVKLALDHLATTLDVKLDKGTGKVTLGALNAHARLARPEKKPFATDISLGGIEIDIAPGKLGATLDKLATGLALLDSLELQGGYAESALSGDQKAVLAGLHLDGDKINRLLGKDLVATNVDVAAKLHGEPDALALGLDVKTRGGSLALTGTVNASRLEAPKYVLNLVAKALATRKLLKDPNAPDVELSTLAVKLDGSGVKKDKLDTSFRIELGKTRIGKVWIEDALVRGRIDHGVVTLDELTVHALGQTVNASGKLVIADKDLDLEVAFDGDVGLALSRLRAAGLPVKSDLPPGAVTFRHEELALSLHGKLDQGLTLELDKARLRVAGGSVVLDGNVKLVRGEPDAEGKQKLGLDTLDTEVKLSGVRLSSLAALRGKKLAGMDGRVSGKIHLTGTKKSPHADVALDVTAKRTDRDNVPAIVAEVRGKGDGRDLNLTARVYRTEPGEARETVASLDAHVPLALGRKEKIASGRQLEVKLDVPRRTLGDLLEMLPPELRDKAKKIPLSTEIEARAEIGGTTSAPEGNFHVEARGHAAGVITQRVVLDGTIEKHGAGSSVKAQLGAWLDETKKPLAHFDARADFARSPLVGGARGDFDWALGGEVGPIDLSAIPDRGLSGNAVAKLDLSGNRHDARGKIGLTLSDVHKGELGPIDAKLAVMLDADATRLDLDARAAGLEALRGKGTIGVAGQGLLDAARAKKLGDPALDLKFEVPRRHIAEWSKLRPKLASLDGDASAEVSVGGTAKEPLVDGHVLVDQFRFADGQPGAISVAFGASDQAVSGGVTLGPPSGAPAIALNASSPRQDLFALLGSKEGDAGAEVTLSARADHQKLSAIVPMLNKDMPKIDADGRLDWNMNGKIRLASHDGVRRVDDASLEGPLALTNGTIPIPGTNRKYHDVALRLAAAPEGLRIETLEAHESDREKSDRYFKAHGELAWTRLRPEHVDLELDARDFLLFGSELLGKPDAPRAALSAKIDVNGDLSKPRRRVDVTVKSLNLRMPDRFEKAHWPEETAKGDVIYLDETPIEVGKLERPKGEESAPPPVTKAEPGPEPEGGTDLFVHIPNRIHAQKQPFTLVAKGELTVKIRPGQKPAVRGELDVQGGAMALGGRMYPVMQTKKSRIFFDAEHPKGELDLWVHYVPNPVALQDVSLASAEGNDIRLHLGGPLSKAESKVNGVGNADLWDMLPVTNAGRVKYVSGPDLPMTETAQLPREYDMVLISYMTVNLPHMNFLDRESAWADPYDDRFSYGRIRHYQAERYSADGKRRIRVNERPATMGQSEAEAEADYLFLNHAHTKAGAGLVAGSRLGGGPSLFFEWQSDD
jgi:TamB, inner membrane protein subunit of TAM complex